MTSADEIRQRAVRALNERRFDVARRLLGQAAHAAETPQDRARVQASSAFLAHEVEGAAAGLARCEAALATPGLDASTRAVVRSQLALLQLRTGDTSAALASFAVAIPAISDPVERGRALINRGTVHLARQEPALAQVDLAAASAALEAVGHVEEAAMSRHNRGYALLLSGDLVGALAEMDRARTVLYGTSAIGDAISDQDRAEVLMASGLYTEAREALHEAARTYGARGLHQRRGEAELSLARTTLLLDPHGALESARRARASFERVAAGAWADRADAIAYAASVDLGRPARTRRGSPASLAGALEQQGLRWPAHELRLWTVRDRLRSGDAAGARELVRTLGSTGRAPLSTRLLSRGIRAELAARSGRRAHALQHLRAGLADLHEWQSSFGSLDLQTGVAGAGTRLGTQGLTLAVESRRPAVLFEWSERARMLASRVQPVRAPEDAHIAADLAELRAMAANGAPDRARELELRQRVRERAWQHRGSGEVADPVTLEELTDALDPGTALVAYVITPGALTALVVTGDGGTTWVDLGRRDELDALLGGLLPDLDMAASDLPDAMGTFVRSELAERLGRLAELLVAPVLSAVGDRRVVLTPSGALAGVPWTLLPGYAGRPVTLAQSATSWLARSASPLRTATAGFVAGPRVARAADEVHAAAKEWPGARVLTGADAAAGAVSELAGTVDVLHVAAHGRHSAENPLFAGLELADGPWCGYDVDRLPRVPDVVLLSACEVGRSTVRGGEELLGMTTAWLHAGARCVIASPAAVNDEAAYDALVGVHMRLAAGADPATALAEAVATPSADRAPVPLICFG